MRLFTDHQTGDAVYLDVNYADRIKSHFICYRNNQTHRIVPFYEIEKSIHEIRDDAKNWYETWVKNKNSKRLMCHGSHN